jgi:Phosphatidylserine/phosphatidylglycerophosphate/cardiolipin synthases and related enzymes
MARRRKNTHWLNNQFWRLAISEWLGLTLAFLTLVTLFCIFLVRRHTLDYHPQHAFSVADQEFFGSALALADPIPIEGNAIDVLQNGDEYFPSMLDAIRRAKNTINLEAYIFYSDEVGQLFRDALCERAQAGLGVRVLLDGLGSSWQLNNSDVSRMKQAGCKFAYYHPTHSWRVDRTNRRTHRRILVIDGRLGFTGGVGFAKHWAGHAQDKEHWRDIQLRVRGPLVAELQAAFQEHWAKTTGEALSGDDQFPALPPGGPLKAQLIASHSFSTAPVPLVQAVAFAAATKRIWIWNAYCTPTNNEVQLLTDAVQRGVDVRLILPGENNDQPLTKSAGRAAYGRLLEGGAKIFEFAPTMMHIKSMVVDGMFSMIGSSNLDARSAEINEELDTVIYDAGFGRAMEKMFNDDLARSRQYTLEQFRNRSLWERVVEWVALPFRSQL